MKSKFDSDLIKEKKLSRFLDGLYSKHLKHYEFERVYDLSAQFEGVDIIFKNKSSSSIYYLDEKAQLDYVNKRLPTFAFELFYEKEGEKKPGWLFDPSKKTQFYALVTNIFVSKDEFTSCNIIFVNRKKLIGHLSKIGLTKKLIDNVIARNFDHTGKLELENLCSKKEGYLYFSTENKAEKPINLILKLNYLSEIGVAKRLI